MAETSVHIRWMIRRDMAEVLATENDQFQSPWLEEDFLRCLRKRNCIGMVSEFDNQIVGYMVYQLHKDKIHVLNFAVDGDFHRQSVGRQMISKLVAKLFIQRRNRIELDVRESNLRALQFFKSLGFQAVSLLRNYYDDTNDDAYVMQYSIKPKDSPKPEFSNRISRHA